MDRVMVIIEAGPTHQVAHRHSFVFENEKGTRKMLQKKDMKRTGVCADATRLRSIDERVSTVGDYL